MDEVDVYKSTQGRGLRVAVPKGTQIANILFPPDVAAQIDPLLPEPTCVPVTSGLIAFPAAKIKEDIAARGFSIFKVDI